VFAHLSLVRERPSEDLNADLGVPVEGDVPPFAEDLLAARSLIRRRRKSCGYVLQHMWWPRWRRAHKRKGFLLRPNIPLNSSHEIGFISNAGFASPAF
jgi:hypothetical protein